MILKARFRSSVQEVDQSFLYQFAALLQSVPSQQSDTTSPNERVALIGNRDILGGAVRSVRGRIRFHFGIAALIDRAFVNVVTRVLIGE